jgi:biotin carboxyl carrier protein
MAVLRSFTHSAGPVSHFRSLEKPAAWPVSSKFPVQGLSFGRKLSSSPIKRGKTIISRVKTSDIAKATSDGAVDSRPQEIPKIKTLGAPKFPNGFEELILGVCDETQIAELKVKIGNFEMHLKRNIESPVSVASYAATSPPPVPSKPLSESVSSTPSESLPKSSSSNINPFSDLPVPKPPKLAALEASGATGYLLVNSTSVGSFRRGRKAGARILPPVCVEGKLIKEGQTIGYVDQFNNSLPLTSNIDGEVIKFLVDDGEAIGYGDPIIAVLPSFHGIR